MYAVVGCTECGGYWLLADPDDSDTATCPRCGRRHQVPRLRRFFESPDRETAREARARLLAEKRGEADAFQEVASVAELEGAVEEAGVDDAEYLDGSGLDVDEVQQAGDVADGDTRSRDEVVRDALREQDRPSEADVVAYATEHGVSAGGTRELLARLVRRGEVTETADGYRLL